MITSEHTVARIGRRIKVSAITGASGRSAAARALTPGACRRFWYRSAVSEFLRPRDDDAIAGLETVEDGVVLAGDRPQLDRLLFGDHLAAGVLRDEGKDLPADAQHRRDRNDEPFTGVPDDPGAHVLLRAQDAVGIRDLPFDEDRLRFIVDMR